MISHFPLSHSVRVISWVLHWREFCFCRQNALPNANSLHSSRTSADLSLPVGGNGRLYGITTVKQRCPSGYITSHFSEHSPPLPDISCSILESLCLILFSSICLISARCHLCVVSVFSLYCCLLALHLVIEATNSSISLESFISQSSLNRFNLIFSCI